jgi:cytoskeleton protein RodZ
MPPKRTLYWGSRHGVHSVLRRPTTRGQPVLLADVLSGAEPGRRLSSDVNSKTSDQTLEGGARPGGAEGSLGEELRRARESRGVSLREVSEHTRITMRHLEAIEADDFKELPGGIFNRSFVKSYARDIRFDERRALELYERTARDRGFQPDEVATTPQRSRIYTGESARSPWVTFALSAVIVGVLILIVYAGLHYYRRTEVSQANGPAPTPTPAAAQGPAATPAPPVVEGFNIQIRATHPFWLTSWQDDEKKKRGRFLKPDAPEEFQPATALNLHYDQASADALQVTVNGRPLKPPTDTTVWTISKDNYKQFAQ